MRQSIKNGRQKIALIHFQKVLGSTLADIYWSRIHKWRQNASCIIGRDRENCIDFIYKKIMNNSEISKVFERLLYSKLYETKVESRYFEKRTFNIII